MSTTDPSDDAVVEGVLLASRALVAVAARSLAGVADEVTLPQYRVLVLLALRGPQGLSGLADALAVAPSTATRMCDRLVRKGLVARSEDPSDRRQVCLQCTASGRRLVAEVSERRRAEIAVLVQALAIPARSEVLRALSQLAEAAGEVFAEQDVLEWQL